MTTKKYLTYGIAGKLYAVPVETVSEVIRPKEILPIPETPHFIEGIMSLRGKVLTVINLRVKLGIEKGPSTRNNRVIVTSIDNDKIGILVDEVQDVIPVSHDNIEPPDEVLKDAQYLTGMANTNRGLMLLIDIEKLLSRDDKDGILEAGSKVEIIEK